MGTTGGSAVNRITSTYFFYKFYNAYKPCYFILLCYFICYVILFVCYCNIHILAVLGRRWHLVIRRSVMLTEII